MRFNRVQSFFYFMLASLFSLFSCSSTTNGSGSVDLGLSVKWGSCNLGANRPEQFGNYFAWGEIETKDFYNWSNYKWAHKYDKLTKYCPNSFCWDGDGQMDNKVSLDPDDDAVKSILGKNWRMPTLEEWLELSDSCIWQAYTLNGVKGTKVTSNVEGFKGNWIFFPAAGFIFNSEYQDQGERGVYWIPSLYTRDPSYARCYEIIGDFGYYINPDRAAGLTIRPVVEK